MPILDAEIVGWEGSFRPRWQWEKKRIRRLNSGKLNVISRDQPRISDSQLGNFEAHHALFRLPDSLWFRAHGTRIFTLSLDQNYQEIQRLSTCGHQDHVTRPHPWDRNIYLHTYIKYASPLDCLGSNKLRVPKGRDPQNRRSRPSFPQ